MQFFIPIIPPKTTHQMKATAIIKGKPVFYEPPALADARAKLSAHIGKHSPAQPLDGPLQVVVKWCFPIIRGKGNGDWKWTRPDAHNLNKLLFDVLTDLHFWNDDAQVASEIIQKFHADVPGIFIGIEKLSGGPENGR
jgi:Holliday junction resolvase RusA-like endonuclease